MKQAIRRVVITIVIFVVAGAIGLGAFVYSGIYNIGADDPHTRPVFALLQTLRERSIALRARRIQVPDLQDPDVILKGAGQYAAMCTQCHLTPGVKDSEIRPGLYPQPPNLVRLRVAPDVAFWVIKHGVKMSAMPAWGGSHDDATIWSMVAFLQKLPDLSPKEYKDMVAKAPPDDDMDMSEAGSGKSAAGQSEQDRAADKVAQDSGTDDGPVMAMPDAPASVAPPSAKPRHHRR